MKKLNYVMIFLFLSIDIWYVVDQLVRGDTSRLLVAAAVIPVLLGPWLIKKIFHYEMNDALTFVYLLFTFCCVILGSVLNLYNRPETQGFDKLTHFISGFLTSFLALIVLKHSKIKNSPMWFNMIFILVFSMAIGAFWEYLEFASDNILGGNTQHYLETGVGDTMWDMIVAFFASLLFNAYYYIKSKTSPNHFEKMMKTL